MFSFRGKFTLVVLLTVSVCLAQADPPQKPKAAPAANTAAKPAPRETIEEQFAKRAAKLWSLQPVARPEVPAGTTKFANPIDAFVSSMHQAKGLHPVGQADRLTLLRRVYFDLIGLPPTPAQQDAFLRDESPNAWEKVVDGLLADPQYGVRWARHWLDVLRYADLDGLDGSVMPAASGIYLWRDWMITELNQDIPYDDFVRAQLLGNRAKEHSAISAVGRRAKPEGSLDDQFALGFLARAALNRGNKEQEIALAAVETVSTAFMGMTVGCAKCHDHMFDPIRQRDFYAMKALFDPLVLKKVVLAGPAEVFANGQKLRDYNRQKAPIDSAIETLVAPYRTKLYEERVSMLTEDVQAVIRKPEKQRTPDEQKIADDYFPVLRIDPSKIREIMPPEDVTTYDGLRKKLTALGRPPELPAFWTVEEDSSLLKEKSYVLTSGDPNRPEKDKPVEPGFPFQPADADFRDGRREEFADWLTSAKNPLFARVAVNRIWQWHFGEGLQRVSSDFGMLGGRPSNQKLLDYLAAEFAAHDFSMKWLHRLIVMSDAYKRASKAEPEFLAQNQKIDPSNTYLWRFRLQRLEAEPIWDSLLYSSGDLDLSLGGRSFMLKQPDAKQSIFMPRPETFDTRTNRRAAYMARGYIPSTDVMPQFLQAFDVDDGRTPCPVRGQTVTAPQALFTMNDELVERQSGKLASAVLAETSGDVRAAITLAYRKTLGRAPTSTELDRAQTYIESKPDRLKAFAWLLFNLDEFIYLR